VLSACLAFGQAGNSKQTSNTPASSKASAYYNFAMGHLYAELAGSYGNRSDYVNKAIDYYRQALKEDPHVDFLLEELTDLYIQAGRLKDAVSEAQDMLKQDPKNLEARRILGRIYFRMIGDSQQGKLNEDMLRQSIEQYTKITEQDPKDVDAWLTLGQLYRAGGNSVDAEKSYHKALDIEPNNEQAMTGMALVYADLGDNKKAADMLKGVSEKNPSPRVYAALAQQYEYMRDYKSAADMMQKAVELQPDNDRFRSILGQYLIFAERYDDALKLYQGMADEDPSDPKVQLELAKIYRQKRDFGRAAEALAKAKTLDKDNLDVQYERVNLLEAQGKNDEAVADLKAMLAATAKKQYTEGETQNRIMLLEHLAGLYRTVNQPEPAIDAYRQIGVLEPKAASKVEIEVVETYRGAKNYAKAREEADAALKQFPDDRMVKMMHASVMADSGKIDQAVAELKPLLNGDKGRETWLALAQIYEKGKRFDEMSKALDEADKLSKTPQESQGIAFMRGAMYERMKQYDKAETEFRKVLAGDPNNAGALNYLGYMLAERNTRLDEAHQLISKAVELDPDNGAYLDSLGWVYYRQNRLDQAENTLMRALDKIGSDPTVHDHLGDVYAKQGKTKDAITQWQASLKEWESSSPAEHDDDEMASVSRKLESAKVRLARETTKH
jgi:tetratricopeptide (TPR) repeat protein